MLHRKMTIPAAMAVVLITAAGAKAQTVTSPGTTGTPTVTNPTPNTNFGQFNTLGSGTGVNGQNNGIGSGFNFDPRLNFGGGSLGYTPGVTQGNQFFQGSGYGYYNPYYNYYNPYYGYNSGPTLDTMGAFYGNNGGNGGMMRRGGLAIAGVNSPPLGRSPYRHVNVRNSGSGSGYEQQAQDRADQLARENPAGDMASRDPRQVQLANRMQSVMMNHAVTQGTVVGKQDGGLLVQFTQDGATRTQRFPSSQVFYFGSTGRIGSGPNIAEGTSVLVPAPSGQAIRQSVAGSRQTLTSAKKAAAAKAKKAHKR